MCVVHVRFWQALFIFPWDRILNLKFHVYLGDIFSVVSSIRFEALGPHQFCRSLSTRFLEPAAAAKLLQSCPTPCDPTDGSPPGSPSLGFSRQEHWSGLPFPSPMHESEKWKWSLSVMSDSVRPHGLQPTSLLHPWDFPGKSTGVGCHGLLQGSVSSHPHKSCERNFISPLLQVACKA